MLESDVLTSSCPRCRALLASSGICTHCMLAAGLREVIRDRPQRHHSDISTLIQMDSPPPAEFGDYQIIEEIAHGGMGVVYLGWQVSLERFVALKFLLPGRNTSPEFIERFKREAKALAGLRHPNIVAVHEVAEIESRQFFSMDFVEGQNLAEVLSAGALQPARAARYCQIIAEAMQYAHHRWVLHRDLKPSNVLIDLSDQPHITDFGLAGKMEVRTDLTMTGQMIGSPSYLSPEQAAGRMHEVSAASDVYAIGAILYECLTGKLPFQGSTLQETLLRIRDESPTRLREINPEIPHDLETICLKCLEKDPAARFINAQALADDLGRWMRNEPICARPPTLIGQGWTLMRNAPRRFITIATLIGITLTLLLFLIGENVTLREKNQSLELKLKSLQTRLQTFPQAASSAQKR